jgi:protein tyrosine phosphatase (PTP) superfamily phosphohydrolase (DUF442 family)
MDHIPDQDRPIPPGHSRQEELDRWRRELKTPWERFSAWVNMIFVDHAFFRWVYLNLHEIAPGAWRSAQPGPYQVKRLARRGIRSIVNLRGGQSYGSLPLEIEAAEEVGVHFEVFVLRSRALPTRYEMREAKKLFDRLEYPALFHCKSGADRSGLMSVLYLIIKEGMPVAEARKHLSIWYGHFKHGKTGILDAMFDAYEDAHPDGSKPFMEWVEDGFDPHKITAEFKPSGIGSFITETLLRRE